MTSKSLWPAFVAAQKDFGAIVKDTRGARGKYAPLDAVLEMVRPVLNKHGLALSQSTYIDGETLIVRTMIVHQETGETHEATYPAGALSLPHQQLGAGVTYARRYSILSIAGVFPEQEDDDGEKAGQAGGKVRSADTGRMVNPGSSSQLKKNGAWDSFTDRLQHFADSRDAVGLRAWFASDAVQERIAGWPESWRDAAHDEFEKALEAADKK